MNKEKMSKKQEPNENKMKKITLISTLILAILLFTSLYYCFFIRTEEGKIKREEVLIKVANWAISYIDFVFDESKLTKREVPVIFLDIVVVNMGENTILIDGDLITLKGKGISEKEILLPFLPFLVVQNGTVRRPCYDRIILTPQNGTTLLKIKAYIDTSRLTREDIGAQDGEINIIYKIVEKNRIEIFNSTFIYIIRDS